MLTSSLPKMNLPTIDIIGAPVTALPLERQIQTIMTWASQRMSAYVCVANTHMLIEAHNRPDFAALLRRASMVTPDGMPLVWMMKLLGVKNQDRVAGMEIFLSVCQAAAQQNLSVFLVGSQAEILNRMQQRLRQEFPNLSIAGADPLPFRPLTPEEDQALIERINTSGANVTLVALGCPKQEIWMAQHKGKIQSVMIGLGGVFPVYAGIQKLAPQWLREAGLEWAYRFAQEPRRLWKRYGSTIPVFVYLALVQLIQSHVAAVGLEAPLTQSEVKNG